MLNITTNVSILYPAINSFGGLAAFKTNTKAITTKSFTPFVRTKSFTPYASAKSCSSWETTCRANQRLPEGDWKNWVILAGRGFGKTRAGAEAIRQLVDSGRYKNIALIGQTLAEAGSIMVHGVSGLLSTYAPSDQSSPSSQSPTSPAPERIVSRRHGAQARSCTQCTAQAEYRLDEPTNLLGLGAPKFELSKRHIIWPNGAIAHIFGADHYNHLRGPQFDLAWIDEFAKFRYPRELYEQLMMCLRLGPLPRCIITTTPRPIAILREILNESGTVTSVGSTFDNAANLSASFLNFVKNRYGNSAFGRQELYGELIFESPGALWRRDTIKYVEQLTEAVASEDAAECCTSLIETERNSARHQAATKDFARVVIGVDPAVTYNDSSDETGIVVMARGLDGKGYVLDDCSGRYPPSVWSSKVVQKYHDFQADLVVAEVNQGGDLVLEMLRSLNRNIPFSGVRATRGKVTRAEPIASLYERGLILHMRTFPKLEDQLCEYVPGEYKKSPDRLDALVWAATELFRVDELRQNVMVLH